MGWDGDLPGWDWTGRDEMGWDVVCAPEPCRRRPRLERLAHPVQCARLDSCGTLQTRWMRWDGMGWDGMVTCRDGIGRDGMRWDGM